jgi:hypothetical protein
MSGKVEYKRVTCGIFLNPEEKGYDPNTGQPIFHPEWINRWKDWQMWFEDEFEPKIEKRFGKDGWAVRFIQVTQNDPIFFVDCYIDGINTDITYEAFAGYIGSLLTIKQFRHTPFLKGTIEDYIQNR